MTDLHALQARDCTVCGRSQADARPFLDSSVDPARMGRFSFASRKMPEFMSFRLVRCIGCEAVFAAEAPSAEALAQAYGGADYDTSEEAISAATTYARALAPRLPAEDRSGTALEIGTGSGVFLRELRRLGFDAPVGVEPSGAAIAAADPDIRDSIREGIFEARDFEPGSLSLVCCFQTLEHVPAPMDLTRAAFDLLRPGGRIAFVTHDYTAPLNRALGRRSPIIDIEHMQLFCPASLRRLLSDGGFERVEVARIRNTYPLRYWIRLLPLPAAAKRLVARIAQALRLDGRSVSLDVGNLLTVARKPAVA